MVFIRLKILINISILYSLDKETPNLERWTIGNVALTFLSCHYTRLREDAVRGRPLFHDGPQGETDTCDSGSRSRLVAGDAQHVSDYEEFFTIVKYIYIFFKTINLFLHYISKNYSCNLRMAYANAVSSG